MGDARSEEFVERLVAILARERKRLRMSHERLADAAGIHRSTVSRIERGLMSPTLLVLHLMASALGLKFSKIADAAERKPRR